jgi:putative spermidine/putrescine transport system ATP-binding protein
MEAQAKENTWHQEQDRKEHSEVMVSIENVRKTYGNTVALNNVSLQIQSGEIITLLGPSGCGKTTLLRIVAGLITPDSGEVRIGGRSTIGLPAHRSEAGMVFQSYALFPHMTVAKNIAFGLEVRRRPRQEIKEMVERTLGIVGLSHVGHRRPGQLSGGQQQRIALARVLAIQPKVLLLDEPFGALDKKLREEMEVEVTRIVRELNITTIFVTHDQEEALVMSDRIAVMDHGNIVQLGPGIEIYRQPATEFVANFVGHANLLDGIVTNSSGPNEVKVRTVHGLEIRFTVISPLAQDTPVKVLIRPENFYMTSPSDTNHGMDGVVTFDVQYGSHSEYQVKIMPETQIKIRTNESNYKAGDRVNVHVANESECVLYLDGIQHSSN